MYFSSNILHFVVCICYNATQISKNGGFTMPIPQNQNQTPRLSIKEQIYQTLFEWIIDGTLQPNEPISDTEIAKYFSASRTPVREALLLLERQNFVQVIPSCGTRVAPITKESAGMIYEALAELCGSAAKMACKKATEEDIQRLKDLNAAFSKAVTAADHRASLQCDADFHEYIFKIAGNQYLSSYAKQMMIYARRYEYYYFKTGVDKTPSIQDHAAIIQAIERRDQEAARNLSEHNWLDFFHNQLEKMF